MKELGRWQSSRDDVERKTERVWAVLDEDNGLQRCDGDTYRSRDERLVDLPSFFLLRRRGLFLLLLLLILLDLDCILSAELPSPASSISLYWLGALNDPDAPAYFDLFATFL